MPVRKYRDVFEMEDNTWHEPGSPEHFRAMRQTWEFAQRTVSYRFPPGVYKHRSIEDAQRLREIWEQDCFDAYQARQRQRASARGGGEPGAS